MLRPLGVLLALALTVGAAAPAAAQERVRLVVTLSDPVEMSGVRTRQPQVGTPYILRDRRWREALENSFPVRLRFRVEIWRVRPDWFDALERSFEWEELIQYEPLAEQYSTLLIFGGSPRGEPERYTTLQQLEGALQRPRKVTIAPAAPGEYYFSASLQIRTLTDEEMEELERFLQGQPSPRDEPNPGGSPIGRAARRLLLGIGGLPKQDLEDRSERFRVGGTEGQTSDDPRGRSLGRTGGRGAEGTDRP
jgi:hypothetical protein